MKKVPHLDMLSNNDFIVFQTRTPERTINPHIKKTRKTRKLKTRKLKTKRKRQTVKSLVYLS